MRVDLGYFTANMPENVVAFYLIFFLVVIFVWCEWYLGRGKEEGKKIAMRNTFFNSP